MKKILAFALMIASLFIMAGCRNNLSVIDISFYNHSIIKDSEKTTISETFAFDMQKLNLNDVNYIVVSNEIKDELEKIKGQILSEYAFIISNESLENKTMLNNNVSLAVYTQGTYIGFKINYANSKVWAYFSDSANDKPKLEYNLLTVKKYERENMIGGLTNLSGSTGLVGDYIKSKVFDRLNLINPLILENVSNLSSYNYFTSSSRLHSTADAVGSQEGYYIHQWNTTEQKPEVKFYIEIARVSSWYVGAIILTGVFSLIYFLSSKNKKQNTENLNQQLRDKLMQGVEDNPEQ